MNINTSVTASFDPRHCSAQEGPKCHKTKYNDGFFERSFMTLFARKMEKFAPKAAASNDKKKGWFDYAYESFAGVSKSVIQGRNRLQQQEVVREVLLSMLPPGAPAQGAEELAKRLYEACLSGSVETLDALIEEDQLILNRVNKTDYFSSETPLHVAVWCGHLDFTKALLNRKPKLATELDSQKCSALHVASTEGHLQIVRELLWVNKDICNEEDQDGRIPLHWAVVKGRVEIIEELLGAKMDSAQCKLDNGETVLHLSIKYNRLEALKTLVKYLQSNDMESLLNSMDDDGNTILHLAADLKQVDTIEYLLEIKSVKDHANDKNQKGFTALDVVEYRPKRNTKDMQIRKLLLQAGAHRSLWGGTESNTRDNHPAPHPPQYCCKAGVKLVGWISWFWRTYLMVDPNWLKELRGHLITTATVTAAMAYQAILSPPGGFWQGPENNAPAPSSHNSSNEEQIPGHPILGDGPHGENYGFFLNLNTIVLVASLGTVTLALSGFPMKNKFLAWSLVFTVYTTIFFMGYAYFVVVTLESETIFGDKVYLRFLAFMSVFTFVFMLHLCHFLVWLCKKLVKLSKSCYSCCKELATNNSTGEDNLTGQP